MTARSMEEILTGHIRLTNYWFFRVWLRTSTSNQFRRILCFVNRGASIRVFAALLVLTNFAATAQAGHHRRHHHGHSYRSGDGAYNLAVRQGGPCGLTVERIVFGTSAHVLNGWNPWRAVEWNRFRHASPAPGMVAVWRNGHHVGVISAVHGDGTFSVTGSSNHARVTLAQVSVVDPHSGGSRYASRDVSVATSRRYRHYASRHYGRGSYRVASSGQYSGTGYGGTE
jgi:hypothetical protein